MATDSFNPIDRFTGQSTPESTEHMERLATLGCMAASAAHEVNNLLTPALAYAQLAANSNDPKMLQKSVDRTIHGIESAARILSAILDFSRPAFDSEDGADIGDVLTASIGSLPRDPARDDIVIESHLDDCERVVLSPLLLQQVLLNLLLNACRVLREQRGGTVRITASCEDDMTRITVADNGPGIPVDLRERIFEPFVSAATACGNGGTGLGLAICRRVVESVGGHIRAIDSDVGATIEFVIPTWRPAVLSQAG